MMTRRNLWILLVASAEQIIGAALSTAVAVVIPLLILLIHHDFPPLTQGILGAAGLIGIAVGSPLIGGRADRKGYLLWFRICPVLIMGGALLVWLWPGVVTLFIGLFVIGLGVGGGYSLDSSYISELMPPAYSRFMVGIAKASSAIGFIGMAALAWLILVIAPHPDVWPLIVLPLGVMGLITLLLRIHWAGSPLWLEEHGQKDKALEAAHLFSGADAQLPPMPAQPEGAPDNAQKQSLWRGENLKRVIFSGIPWACEGLGVYGFGVFLPVLIMALGIERPGAEGIDRIVRSVELTTAINAFILVGFIVGLAALRRMNHLRMLILGFIGSAAGLLVLLAAWHWHWHPWVSIAGFCIFELALNGGPHLITYIIPAAVFPTSVRATGSGVAAMLGKVGAIVGVLLMPMLLKWGGMSMVLTVSTLVMLAGAAIAAWYGRQLGVNP